MTTGLPRHRDYDDRSTQARNYDDRSTQALEL
jgi:hypothetical protein